MDFLPIPKSSTNKVNTAINLANDGGSKSNTGYMNQRNGEQEPIEESVDEVTLSASKSKEVEEKTPESDFKKFFNKIQAFFRKINDFYRNLFAGNKIDIENIYEEVHIDTDIDIDVIEPEKPQEESKNDFQF